MTGPVACGKSTLGRVFLCERPYDGSVRIGGRELSDFAPREIAATVGYLGHDPELWNDTVEANVLCGDAGDAMQCSGHDRAGRRGAGHGAGRADGGGQQRRAAFRRSGAAAGAGADAGASPAGARAGRSVFRAGRQTEDKVFANLKAYARDKVVILISHRLYHFPEMQQIVFMEDGKTDGGDARDALRVRPGLSRPV